MVRQCVLACQDFLAIHLIADQNVWLVQIVLGIKLAITRNALILVLVLVAGRHCARLSITILYAVVLLVSVEILSLDVNLSVRIIIFPFVFEKINNKFLICNIVFIYFDSCESTTGRHVRFLSMWSQFHIPNDQRQTVLYLFARFYRFPAKL